MSHHHHSGSGSRRSQQNKFRRIEWMRKAKRWLRKSMIIIIILLSIAVVLSYIFITKPSEPQDIEVHKTLLDRIWISGKNVLKFKQTALNDVK